MSHWNGRPSTRQPFPLWSLVLINYALNADARENAWRSIQSATGCSRATTAEIAKRLKDAA